MADSTGLTSDQQSAQDYINNSSSGFGGIDKYTQTQQQRYNDAVASGDSSTIDHLNADAKRVGYSLNNSTTNTVPYIAPGGSTAYKPAATGTTSSAPDSSFAPRSIVSQMNQAANNPVIPQTQASSQGTDHIIGVDGKPVSDGQIVNNRTVLPLSEIEKAVGMNGTVDPKTGLVTIGGKQFTPIGRNGDGSPNLMLRNVTDALGFNIDWNAKTMTGTVLGKPDALNKVDTGTGQTGWAPPDFSGMSSQMMPYGTFNNDMTGYYNQAHNQLDAQYNQQKQALIDKQNQDITNSNESMNRRGIYSSGVAQSVEDDLRTKTTAAISNVLASQMANVAKTAQSLYDTAYKQYMDGNTFALKNNQAVINNMLNSEKQSFNEYIQTHKLSDAETNAANAEFDKQAALIQKDNQSKLPYEFQTANNIADNQTKQDIALLPYQQMTVYQQMTTQEKSAMDQATNYFKQQGIAVDYAKLAESIRHNTASETNTANGQANTAAHNTATETETNRHNVADETNAANKAANTIDPKESYSQATSFKSQLNDKLSNDSKNINHSKAAAFIDANKGVLTDSDYRDLQAWVDTTFKK